MMEIIEIESMGLAETYVVITDEDGSTLSMLKSTWDELEKAKELG